MIAVGPLSEGSVKNVNAPAGVSRPIWLLSLFVNQMLPSGPVVIPSV